MAADIGGGRKLSGGPDASFEDSHHHWSVLHCGWGASRGRGCNHQRSEGACRYLATRALEGRVGEIIRMRTFIKGITQPETKVVSSSFRWYRVETNFDHWLPPPARDHRRWVILQEENFGEKKLKLVLFRCYCVSDSQRSSQQSTKRHRSRAHKHGDTLSGKDGVINQYSMKRSTHDTETRCILQICTETTNSFVFFPSQVLSLFPVCNG